VGKFDWNFVLLCFLVFTGDLGAVTRVRTGAEQYLGEAGPGPRSERRDQTVAGGVTASARYSIPQLDCFSFTVVVKCGEGTPMKEAHISVRRQEADAVASVRATISFPSDRYATLEEIAKRKKVSLAWVVREAVDAYIAAKWPLFLQGG
jgi:hypothetical protein